MTHDPLCPWPKCDYGQPDAECTGYDDCTHLCLCGLIAQSRADERERCGREAQEAVARLDIRSDHRYTVNDPAFHQAWRDGWQTGHDAAITATYALHDLRKGEGHDRLCPFAPWPEEDCYQRDAGTRLCDLIAKARADERSAPYSAVDGACCEGQPDEDDVTPITMTTKETQ